MSIPFNEFRFIFPPKTASTCSLNGKDESLLAFLGYDDVIAQYKINGTRLVLYIFPDGHQEYWGRNNTKLKYSPLPSVTDEIAALAYPKNAFNIFDCELLHSKSSDERFKHRIVIFDVLVWDGQWLLGETYQERYNKVMSLFRIPRFFHPLMSHQYHCMSLQNLVANMDNLRKVWVDEVERSEIVEGYVLKRIGEISRLERGNVEINNNWGLMRIRKPTKNYIQ